VVPSNYRIRKAHALGQLEGSAGPYGPLLDAFDGFVTQQAAFIRA